MGPKLPQDGPKMAQKWPQGGPQMPPNPCKIVWKYLREHLDCLLGIDFAHSGLLVGPIGLKRAPRWPPGPAMSAKKHQKTIGKLISLKNMALSIALALRMSSWPHGCSTWAQHGPKRAPRWPNNGPKAALKCHRIRSKLPQAAFVSYLTARLASVLLIVAS